MVACKGHSVPRTTLFICSLALLAPIGAQANESRTLSSIATKWSCSFQQDLRNSELVQGVECSVDSACAHPAQQNPLTYTTLNPFVVDLQAKQISYSAVTRWMPAARTRIREKLRRDGAKDDTDRLEREVTHTNKILDVITARSSDTFLPAVTTVTFTDQRNQVSTLHVISNGKQAIVSQPIAIADRLAIAHYFGSCYPQ